MKKIRSFVALCLVMAMAFSFSATAFAAAPDEAVTETVVVGENETIVYQDDEMTIVETPVGTDVNAFGVSPLATSYNSRWLDTSANGSFTVYTSNTGTIGITLKVESPSDSSTALISIKKPNGSYYKNNIFLTPGENGGEGQYKIYFAQSGSYTYEYSAWTNAGMRIMCWMY